MYLATDAKDKQGKPTKKILNALERQMENIAQRAKANKGTWPYLPVFPLLTIFLFQWPLTLTLQRIARRPKRYLTAL